MAITIQQQPLPTASAFYPVGNPIEFLVSTSLSAAQNIKIETKVYSPDSATTPLATMRYDIIPSTTQILADVKKILQSTITEGIVNLRTSATNIKSETTKNHTAKVTFAESYGAIPSVTGSPTASNIFNFWNAAWKYKGWTIAEVGKYWFDSTLGANAYTSKLLTGFNNGISVDHGTVVGSPATYFNGAYNVRKITSTQLVQLSWLWMGAGGTNSKVTIYAYKSDFSGNTSGYGSLASSNGLKSLNIAIPLLTSLSGSLTLDSTYKYLSLTVKNESAQLGQTYLFEIDWSPCSKFDSYEIHWLNRYGGWDSWIFNKRSRHNTEIERQGYNPTFLPISGSSIVRNSYDITGRNYIVSTKETYILNSNYLKAWELEGLEDLITSPSVYWNSSDGFVNISIKNPNTFEHKTNAINKLFNVSFEFEIDNQDIRQLP